MFVADAFGFQTGKAHEAIMFASLVLKTLRKGYEPCRVDTKPCFVPLAVSAGGSAPVHPRSNSTLRIDLSTVKAGGKQ